MRANVVCMCVYVLQRKHERDTDVYLQIVPYTAAVGPVVHLYYIQFIAEKMSDNIGAIFRNKNVYISELELFVTIFCISELVHYGPCMCALSRKC